MKAKASDNLAFILQNTASRFPDQTAIRLGDQGMDEPEITFDEVRVAVLALAERLQQRGVVRDDRVAILISNCPSFSISYFACLWLGAVVVPINPILTDREIETLLEDSEPGFLIFESSQGSRQLSVLKNSNCIGFEIDPNPISSLKSQLSGTLGEPVAVDQKETAVILYTSGSTGRPKGVELTHRNLYLNARSVSEEKFSSAHQKNVLGPGDVGLAALPLSHAFGQTNFQNGMWFHGGCIVYQFRFDAAKTIELIENQKVTFFAGVPTMYVELNREAKNRTLTGNRLKYCVCGGAALPDSVKKEFQQIFGVTIQESYGLSETGPMVSCQKIDQATEAGSVGPPIAGVEVRLVDENGIEVPQGEKGEIQVRGHNVFRRYFRNVEETNRVFVEDWFRTGDVGIQDATGNLKIVDRIKEIIIRGGYTIYPREIENVLNDQDWIEQSVVIGVPDNKYGESVKALIKLSAVHQGPTTGNPDLRVEGVLAEIDSVCKKNLASFKRPRFVEIVSEFPLGSTGKIDRKQLRTGK